MQGFRYPALYYAANAASNRAQSRTYGLLGASLTLLVVVSALSSSGAGGPPIWFAASTLLLLSFGASLISAMAKPARHWYAARAIAESVKTATWRFAIRADPFDQDDEEAAIVAFTKRLREIFEQNKTFSARFSDALDGEQLPQELLECRRANFVQRRGMYRDLRIAEQKKWYSGRAQENSRANRLGFLVALVAMAIAVLVHFWRALEPTWSIWPGDTIVAIALAVIAWIQAKRYQELAESYSIAAQDIAIVEAEMRAVNDEVRLARFVMEAESAFSREHTQWVARKHE